MRSFDARAVLLLSAALLPSCGGAPAGDTGLRAELAPLLEAARADAGAEVAAAEAELARAELAEAAGELEAAAEHRAAARLLAALAHERAARAEIMEAHAALEREASALDEEAVALEAEAVRDEAAASRLAAARAAREEALRAFARAEAEEARGRRRGRLSLDDAAAMREAAVVIRRRARLLATAAASLDASAGAARRAELEDWLARSEAEADPVSALRSAEQAHRVARALLGAARRGRPIGEPAVRALLEAALADGFDAARLERGVAIDAAFALLPAGRSRIGRLAALLSAHPEGPVQLEVAADDARGEALLAALVDAGVPAERLRVEPGAAAEARLVLLAYAPAAATDAVLEGEPPATSAAVPADPTPERTSD